MSTNVFTDEMSNELLHHVPGLDYLLAAPQQEALQRAGDVAAVLDRPDPHVIEAAGPDEQIIE